MNDHECTRFLQWALPRLGLRWSGFRKVRAQVCKRVQRRMNTLGLDSAADYRRRLEDHPEEWDVLDGLCYVSISRFYRDRGVFEGLRSMVLPELARMAKERGADGVPVWSAGCASGEEVYSLTILWRMALRREFPDLALWVTATDTSPVLLGRAERARYPAGSLRELPDDWREAAFEPGPGDGELELKPAYREGVELRREDMRRTMPQGPFDLVMCRNLAFTYFEADVQEVVASDLMGHIRPGGALVIGRHEKLPASATAFVPWPWCPDVYRRSAGSR